MALGETERTYAEIEAIVDALRIHFQGPDYHIIGQNCNHFSDALAKAVLGRGIPSYVNRLAGCGSVRFSFLPVNAHLFLPSV